VFRFFEKWQLTPERLRDLSQHQVELLAKAAEFDPSGPQGASGGFLAIPVSRAAGIQVALRQQNIWTDYRGDTLRLGPAPYISDAQLTNAATELRNVLRTHR
jgi:kynureninase